MSKILEASCAAGIVTSDGVPVVGATVLSEGVAPSSGLLFLEEDKATYLPSSATDIKDLIGRMDTILEKIIQIATSLDAAALVTGTAAANIVLLTALKVELALSKELLK